MKICPTCQTQFKDGSMRFCTKDGTPLINFVAPVVVEEPPTVVAPPPVVPPITTPPATTPSPLDETLSDIPKFSNNFNSAPESRLASPADSLPDDLLDDLSHSATPDKESENLAAVTTDQTQPNKSVTPQSPPVMLPTAVAPPTSPATAVTTPVTPKRKSKVALYAVLGILGFIGLLGIISGAGAYWYFSSSNTQVANNNTNAENDNSILVNDPANVNDNSNIDDPLANANANQDVNENLNANVDGIQDDGNLNMNGATNLNANARPSPSPRTSPSPSPRNANRNANQIIEIGPSQPTPTPNVQPTAVVTQPDTRTIAGGVVNGKATSLIKPAYPAAAKAVRAEGQVNVQVLIDENGNVVSASAISGNSLLRQAAQQAARQSKFAPTSVSGRPVKVSGVIIYNFTMNQ